MAVLEGDGKPQKNLVTLDGALGSAESLDTIMHAGIHWMDMI